MSEEKNNMAEEEMTVELELEDGSKITCAVVTIFQVGEKDYIALLPLGQPEEEDGDVWIYRYSENPDDPNEEPSLDYIEDDEEYEAASDAFDEFLDSVEFDELVSDDDEE